MKFLASGLALIATAKAGLLCHSDGSATLTDVNTGTDKFFRSAEIEGCTGLTYDSDGTVTSFTIPSECMADASPAVGTTAEIIMHFSPNADVPILQSAGKQEVNCETKNTYLIEYTFANVQVGEEELDDTNSNVLSFNIQRWTDDTHNTEADPADMVKTNTFVYLSISANNFNSATHQYIPSFCEVSQGSSNSYTLFDLSDPLECVENYTKTKLTKSGDDWFFEFEAFSFTGAEGDDYKIACSVAVCAAGDVCNIERDGTSVVAVDATCASDDGLHGY